MGNKRTIEVSASALIVVSAAVSAVSATVMEAQNPPISTAPQGRRQSPAQPQQKQGVEYLAGTWAVEWTGRESAISAGPRAGTTTFTRQGTPSTLAMTGEGKTDAGPAYKESGSYVWDETKKTLTITEQLADGVQLKGVGNWSSPLSIQFESEPVQVKGQSIKIRRTYSILSAVSFSVVEEMSTNGGPYQRLGNGEYLRK